MNPSFDAWDQPEETFVDPSVAEYRRRNQDPSRRRAGFVIAALVSLAGIGTAGTIIAYMKDLERRNAIAAQLESEKQARREAFEKRYTDSIAVIDTSTQIDQLSQLAFDLSNEGNPEFPDLHQVVSTRMTFLRDWMSGKQALDDLHGQHIAAVSSLNRTRDELTTTRNQLTEQSERLHETAQQLAHRERMLELTHHAMTDATAIFADLSSTDLAALSTEQDVLKLPSYVQLRAAQIATRVPENNADELRKHYSSHLDSEVVELTRRSRDKQALEQAQSEQRALATQLERWRSQYGDLSRLSDAEKRRLLTEYFAQRGYFRIALSSRTAQTVEQHMAGECTVEEGPWGDGCSNYSHIEEDYQRSLRNDDDAVRARTQLFITLSTRDHHGRTSTVHVPFVSRDVQEAMQQGIAVFYPNDPSKLRGVGRYGVLLSEALRSNPASYLQTERKWRESLQAFQAENPQQDR